MTEARWARVTKVFRQALDLPGGDEREAWLNEMCGTDDVLRQLLHAAPRAQMIAKPRHGFRAATVERAPVIANSARVILIDE